MRLTWATTTLLATIYWLGNMVGLAQCHTTFKSKFFSSKACVYSAPNTSLSSAPKMNSSTRNNQIGGEYREVSKHPGRQKGRGPRSAQESRGMQRSVLTLCEWLHCPELGPPEIHSHIQQMGMEHPLSMPGMVLVPGDTA